jgi:glycosyltransferase involved in cell wall biosynthesis
MPQVSIVIPTFNRAADLERALASVRSQTFEDWEAVVVDNHSTDRTDSVVTTLADRRISLHKIHNGGVIASSRNLGLRRAQSDVIAFLDADDWWAPRKLEMALRALRDGADIVYHDLFAVKRADQTIFWRRARTRQVQPPVFDDLVANGNAMITSGVAMRRAILDTIGGFSEDPAMVAMEDYDTWIRASRVTDRFVRLGEVLGYYWEGEGKTTNAARTLRLLDLFDARYGDSYRAACGAALHWIDYDRGRSYIALGNVEKARASLRRVRLTEVSPSLAAKTMWTLAQIRWRRLSRRATR